MKVRYPDIVYGAIASSGVAHATLRDWRYFDLIRQSATAACMAQVERAVAEVDALLAEPAARAKAQTLFGLPNVTHVQDFAAVLMVRAACPGFKLRSWVIMLRIAGVRCVVPTGVLAGHQLGPVDLGQHVRRFLRRARLA